MISPCYTSIEDFDDIESKNFYAEFCETMTPEEAIAKINFGSRDNTRRPMCWNDSKFGGFSDAEPWIKPHSMVKELNLKTDLASEKSVFRFYQQLLKVRAAEDALTLGSVKFLSKDEDNYFITLREYEDRKVAIVCNFEEVSDIRTGFKDGKLLLSNYGGRECINGEYQPFEIAVYQL